MAELPLEMKNHLDQLKKIPGAVDRFIAIASDLIDGKIRREDIIDPVTNEVIGGILIEN